MPSLAELYPSFIATDEDGRRHVLKVMPGARGVATPNDPLGRIPGPRRVVLEGGGAVDQSTFPSPGSPSPSPDEGHLP